MPQWRKLHVKAVESLDCGQVRRCYNRLARGMREPRTAIIYGLVDPDTDELRYIGKTTCEPSRRLHLHLSEARRQCATPKTQWIRALLREGKRPVVVALQQVDYGFWPEAERRWVRAALEIGCDLLNSKVIGGGP